MAGGHLWALMLLKKVIVAEGQSTSSACFLVNYNITLFNWVRLRNLAFQLVVILLVGSCKMFQLKVFAFEYHPTFVLLKKVIIAETQ